MNALVDARLELNIRVTDLDVSCAWYERIFGAPPIFRGVDRSFDGTATTMVCFRIGSVKLWILPAKSEAKTEWQSIGVALMVRQPLGPIRRDLEARGARFDDTPMAAFPIDKDGIRQGKDAEFFFVVDPDGHRIEFCRAFA